MVKDFFVYNFLRNFIMVGKNMGHPLDKIKWWKNRRYLTEST
jgi:hypothetical protein